jgi:hypothetical protein
MRSQMNFLLPPDSALSDVAGVDLFLNFFIFIFSLLSLSLSLIGKQDCSVAAGLLTWICVVETSWRDACANRLSSPLFSSGFSGPWPVWWKKKGNF